MIKIIDLETEHLTEYERKYVFTEAPTEKERVNVKRISLRAPDKRTYDFRKGADDDPEEDATEEPAEDVTTDDTTDIVEDPGDDLTEPAEDDTEVPDEDLNTEDNPEEDTTGEDDIVVDDETIEPDDGEDPVDTDGEDTGEEPNVDDTEGDDGTEDIVTDDDPAITDDEGDVPADDTNPDDQDTGDENAGEKDIDEEEKIHKQNLFKKFITLRTSIENYDAKLSSMIGIDADTHEMITEISEKLRSLAEMMYDYMVLKFKKNSYLESMLFYQRTVAAVNLCLDSLDKIRQISIMQTDKTKRKNK